VTVLGMRPKDAADNDGDGPITVVYTGVVDADEGPITEVYTGVPRAGDPTDEYESPSGLATSSEPEPAAPVAEAPRPLQSAPATIPSSPPKYVRVTIRHEPPPGEIAQAWFEVRGKQLVLTNELGEEIARRVLVRGDDPEGVAREMLRERAAADAFNRGIEYPSRAGCVRRDATIS
jgi:hypothetical protein